MLGSSQVGVIEEKKTSERTENNKRKKALYACMYHYD